MNAQVLTVTLNPAIDKTVHVERFVRAQLNRIKSVRTDAGGKGINVAKVLKSFEVDVAAWGLQAGHEGKILQAKLDERGIAAHFIETAGQTRTNLKVVEEATRETTELNEPGFSPSPDVLEQFAHRFEAQMPHTSAVVLGGSLPPGTPADYYKRLIEIASRHGVKTILDADGEALKHGIEASPYALKPNIHELEALCGRELPAERDIVAAARELLGRGSKLVIVSRGALGSVAVSGQEQFAAKPFPITPMSTVGAGDSMVAAMAYALLGSMTLEETARWAAAAGTVTASKQGTEVCTLAEVREKLELVEVTRLQIND